MYMTPDQSASSTYGPAQPDDKGRMPLHFAVMKGDPSRVARYVLERGQDPNAQDNQQNTPLHWAIWNRRMEMIEPLLEHGANPNIQNYKGHAALHHLFARIHDGQDRHLLKCLMDANANPAQPDNHGNTPYHMLALGTFRSVETAVGLALYLTERCGVDGWSTLNCEGLTPLGVARQQPDEHWLTGFAVAVEYGNLSSTTQQATAAPAPRSGRL
jgi:hypothetical protein